MQYLVLLSGTEKGKAIRLNKAITLGRHKSCDLVIRLKQISRRHCKVSKASDGAWVVTDLGTSNGTKVNDAKVIEHRLEDGDEILVSSVRLRFRDEARREGQKAAAAAPAAGEGADQDGEEIEPTIAMHDDGDAAEMTAAVDMDELLGSKPKKPSTSDGGGGGIRFGLGLAAGGGELEDEAEGTAFMDMESVLGRDEEVEGTQFVDMKDLMMAGHGTNTGLAGVGKAQFSLFLAIGVLVLILGSLIVYKKVINPGKEVVKLPNQVLDSAQRVTWPYPEHISFKISDENVVTGIPGGDKKSVILVGGNPGLTQIRLVAKKKVYTAQIKVIEPPAVQLCRRIRERFTQLSGSSQLAQAKEFYNRGLSLYEQREEHLKNLYESCQEVRRAWCLLEQMNTKPSIYYLTKALLDKAEKELRDRYRKSDRQAMLFINLRDFWRLKQELEIILDLIPNPQDSRHQRVLAIWDYYAREIDRSAPREVKSRKRR